MAPPGQAANGLMIYIHSTVEIDIDIEVTKAKILCSGFVDKTLSWGFWKLFPTGTYAIIGTTCVKFENVMKSTTKKKEKKKNLCYKSWAKFQAQIYTIVVSIEFFHC